MTAQEIRKKFIEFNKKNSHSHIPRSLLIPQDDPTTLFTGSGMQPLVNYLLGEEHPEGKRLVDSQTCFRAEDMDEVGDNRHTTFFEMLGNWSLGDYFKVEQLPWFWTFLTEEIGLEPQKLYVTCFIGDEQARVVKDTETAHIWKRLFSEKGIEAKEVEIGSELDGYQKGMQGGRIFYYDAKKNWWSRGGTPSDMALGEPGGPDSEVFYEFSQIDHDPSFGQHCHPNCDCGRFMEIGNSVFMAYKKVSSGFEKLPAPNVDFGGGLERLAAASIDSPDMFKISLLWPIIEQLQKLSNKNYDEHQKAMRVISDHLRAAMFLIVDGAPPSNKEQGYVVRRLMRRAIRFAFDLGIENDLCINLIPEITSIYKQDFPELLVNENTVIESMVREEKAFRQTLRKGLKEFEKLFSTSENESQTANHGKIIFELYDTYGFPVELSVEEAGKQNKILQENWRLEFDSLLLEQKERSRTATAGVFKGGLADHSEDVVKYHTTTHLMYQALKNVLGNHVVQRGSNITAERIRFDFTHPDKVSPEQLTMVEDIVNEQIKNDLPVIWREEFTEQALMTASGSFGDKYGELVKVYTIGDPDGQYFSKEICGGPHVEHTGVIGEGGKRFKVTKEEASSSGVRRIKAVLQ